MGWGARGTVQPRGGGGELRIISLGPTLLCKREHSNLTIQPVCNMRIIVPACECEDLNKKNIAVLRTHQAHSVCLRRCCSVAVSFLHSRAGTMLGHWYVMFNQ